MSLNIPTNISSEFKVVNGVVEISIRGLSRLTTVNISNVSRQLRNIRELRCESEKTLEGSLDKGSKALRWGMSLDEAKCIICYYAFETTYVTSEVIKHCRDLIDAFATLGLKTWVEDMFGFADDTTAVMADINSLVGLYPGLSLLKGQEETETKEMYLSCRQYLVSVKKIVEGSSKFEWMNARLPKMASQTYQSLKQSMPKERGITITNYDGKEIAKSTLKTYLVSELPILDMGYERLLDKWLKSQDNPDDI